MMSSDFIAYVAPHAIADMKKTGILASLTIAQAILESGFGTSELAVKGKALFGIKATNWTGKKYTKLTGEYVDGKYITVTADFRAYDSWAESIADHGAFLSSKSRYANLIGETDYKEACRKIKEDGYATSPTYTEKLIDLIERYDLMKYDKTEVEVMGKKVFLSAGHGGTDPGATANGLKEKDINLQTLLACKDELERHGVKVVCSRTKDENDPVSQEVKEANASGADLAVSFHANAGGGDGFEAFYWANDEKGKKLASLGEKYVKALGQNSRGLKSGNQLSFVKETKMTAVLFESFFLDNAKDKTIGDTTAEQKRFGVAYAKAILEYLGIEYKEEAGTLYRVQVGAYSVKANAEKLRDELKKKGYDAIIV